MSREIEDGSGWDGPVPQRDESSYEDAFYRERDAYNRLVRENDDLRQRIQRTNSLLRDGALQFDRLTGPNLETYARTFSALSKQAIA